MSSVKSVSKLEDEISKELWKRGYRFRRNTKSLKGKPDFSVRKYKIVIFIDSCFWHHCPLHGSMPKTNKAFWKKKLSRNVERDKEVTHYYLENNWNILRIWEHEFKEDFGKTLDKIELFLKNKINLL